MDLIKIGKYIAGKRKSLGMTQKQLAEKLGMSDKSLIKGNGSLPAGCICL
ncbi:MAG: helix-turn-helix domain-containing protein [Blautia wexlerae]